MFADIGIGILISIFITWITGVELTPVILCLGIIFALLPDIDMLVFAFPKLKKIFGGHREITHYPVLYIPLFFIVWGFFGRMWALLFVGAIILHSVHDTLWIGHGVKWLWPFSHKSYQFFSQEKYMKPGEHWITTFYFRLNPVTIMEYSILIAGIGVLVIYSMNL